MLKNKIFHISKSELLKIKEERKKSACFNVTIEGDDIKTKEEFFSIMADKFKLPDSNGWDSFIDWMTDLSWINEQCICFVIEDYSLFLKEDSQSKEMVTEIFEEDILPFWENEVTEVVVDGKPRQFDVYLID
ncbi:barstar family protein [Listeria kieliensis]|nr:barstar family protein [Listeria kieliensis]